MKIFDCFTIRDEIDTALLRLSVHDPKVDHFVICESSKTHQNKDKLFNLEKYWSHFSEFHSKITYIKVEDSPQSKNFWVNEKFQRDAISRGLTNASADDVICVTDCDEFIRPEAWDQIRADTENNMWAMRMPTFEFKLNYLMVSDFLPLFYSGIACAARNSLGLTPTQIKHLRMKDNEHWFRSMMFDFDQQWGELPTGQPVFIEHGGWHFSNMEHLKDKGDAGADQRSSIQFDEEKIPNGIGADESCPERFVPIVVDSYFPDELVRNKEQWSEWLIDDATATLTTSEPFREQSGVSFKSKADLDREGEENGYSINNWS